MKKIYSLFIALAVLACSAVLYAGNIDNQYKKPVVIKASGFKAKYEAGSVEMSWKKYKRQDLKYYKVVRSSTNPNPVYPDDGYIFYSADASQVSYTDSNPEPGVWYYRLCIVTNTGDRWVSPVVKITVPRPDEKGGNAPSASDFE